MKAERTEKKQAKRSLVGLRGRAGSPTGSRASGRSGWGTRWTCTTKPAAKRPNFLTNAI
jgi:hypothetical protein